MGQRKSLRRARDASAVAVGGAGFQVGASAEIRFAGSSSQSVPVHMGVKICVVMYVVGLRIGGGIGIYGGMENVWWGGVCGCVTRKRLGFWDSFLGEGEDVVYAL